MAESQEKHYEELLRSSSYQEMRDLLFRTHLEMHDGNRRKAAESLGVSERTLYYWIQKQGK